MVKLVLLYVILLEIAESIDAKWELTVFDSNITKEWSYIGAKL